MRWSNFCLPLTRQVSKEAVTPSHQWMLKTGMIHQVMSGVYSYLPFGLRAMRRIEDLIRKEMNNIGGNEVLLPCLQPRELWVKTDRVQAMGDVLMSLRGTGPAGEDGWTAKTVLGATHEEIITDLAANFVKSHKQLPLMLYQIQTKFRNEPRPQGGLVRTREFVMKDAYSFHTDAADLDRFYEVMMFAYGIIFGQCRIAGKMVEAEGGAIGSGQSHEFVAGDLEIGHIFKLGDKYSTKLNANFTGADNVRAPLQMGCYGIGVGRLLSAIIEANHDDKGIIWPKSVAPFDFLITVLDQDDEQVKKVVTDVVNVVEQGLGRSVLIDDRSERAGVKFNEGDMIGIPVRITIGKRGLETGMIELKDRRTGNTANISRLSFDPDTVDEAVNSLQ